MAFLWGWMGRAFSAGQGAPVLVAVHVVRPRCAAGRCRWTAPASPAPMARTEEGHEVDVQPQRDGS
ncbi:MAG: hypothetical protein QOI25_1992 [Mycobacterium sp.]|nr:hypothetical protein [Mycobacterium sp.]